MILFLELCTAWYYFRTKCATKVHPRGACRQLATTTTTTFSSCTTEEATTRTEGANGARAVLFGPRRDPWWTGCRPEVAPGMRPNGTISSLPQLFLGGCNRKVRLLTVSSCYEILPSNNQLPGTILRCILGSL